MAMGILDFPISDWLPRFPLNGFPPEELPLLASPSPAGICYAEKFRRRVVELPACAPHRTNAVDAFVLKPGESPALNATKMGGVPYRPRDLPWPSSARKERPMEFVAQFNFTGSRDLVPTLPGDILLVFFSDWAAWPHDEMFPEPPHFEWHPAELNDSMSSHDLPTREAPWFPACHGTRHRTVDFVDGERFVDDLLSLESPKVWEPLYPEDAAHPLAIRENRFWLRGQYAQLNMLKIGGIPLFRSPETGMLLANRGCRFLCTIPSIYGVQDLVPGWIEDELRLLLVWSEGGCVHLFLNEQGQVVPWYEPDKLDQ